MAKAIKKEKPVRLIIDLPEAILKKLQTEADKEYRDRKNHIQKILVDHANKLPD